MADLRALGPGRRGRTLAVAFDEVLTRAPRGADPLVVEGAPREGAIDWLERAVERFDVAIVSARAASAGGVDAMRAWLREHGLSAHAERRIRFPRHKPPADGYLAARALRFDGRFPPPAEIDRFWNSAQDSRA